MRDKFAAGMSALLSALAMAVAPAAFAAPFKLSAFGDSLMDGYGLQPGEGFVPRMQEELAGMGLEVEVVDHASSGDTTADGLTRLSAVIGSKPDGVLLSLGSNDALRTVDPKATAENLDEMLRSFSAAGIPVMLVGAQAPLNWGLAYKAGFDGVYPSLAKAHDVPLYPFILEGVALDPALNLDDGVHPNPRGIDVMVERMAPQVADFIKSNGD